MVELTREEEEMLYGAHGEAVARAMEVIVRVAESLGAPRLVPIKHAHVSGVSYGTIGEAGAVLLESFASSGARFRVPTSVNPIGYDPEDPDGAGILVVSREFIRGQQRILKALKRMGADLLLTCTPYYTEAFEKYSLSVGDRVAWGESSAVAYANTVLGLKTNREGGPLALMAAITGRTYLYGLQVDENRMPSHAYKIGTSYDEAVLGVLAEYLAENHESEKPPMIEVPRPPRDYEVREFAAALGAAGSIGMAVIPGVTPLPKPPEPEKFEVVPEGALKRRLAELEPDEGVDLVFVGCPHASLEELALINARLGKARIPVLVTLSRDVYARAKSLGLIERLRSKGVLFLRSTCLIVSRAKSMRIATNSYKAYFYLSKRYESVGLAPLSKLLEIAGGAR
ncbi:MAG: aconitase X catalytic domain-containing protein [Desulfurococcales archaeon]|nr:aconitase X catalytic domain-containing protein [Desulfurococcales archaeon]